MTEKELKQAIKEVVKQNYLHKEVNFGEGKGTFKVEDYRIWSRKSIGIERYEFEDYGIDEDTQRFIIVEFWDTKNECDVTDCYCCIFTLNAKGQLGTSDTPYDFELDGAYDLAIEMADQIQREFNRQKEGGS